MSSADMNQRKIQDMAMKMADDPMSALEMLDLPDKYKDAIQLAKQVKENPDGQLDDDQKKLLELAKNLEEDPVKALEDADLPEDQR